MSSQQPSVQLYQKIILAALVLAAALVRLVDLSDEPLELHPARQMRSAVIARAFYYDDNLAISPEEKAFAAEMLDLVGVIEPPILETISVGMYRLAGIELPWLGRLTSIVFWLAGGWAVFRLGSRVGSIWGGIAALAYYLFLPFGMQFSRTLLPDPMMVSLSVTALALLLEWNDRRTWGWVVLTGAVTGLAILVKTVAGLILVLPFAVFLLSTRKAKFLIKDFQTWVVLILAALPTAVYYFWGIVIDGRLTTQFSGRFFPELWGDPLLYKSWGLRIIMEFSFPAFLLAMAGILLARKPAHRWLLLAWWAGYFVYGMTFAYHIMTHDYYHLPMVPLAAVSLGPVIAAVEKFLARKSWPRWVIPAMLTAAVAGYGLFGSLSTINFLNEIDYRQTKVAYQEIGQFLDERPEGRVFALTRDYEISFKFYTSRIARHWPHTGDQTYFTLQGSVPQDFSTLWEKVTGFDYFLVEDTRELNRQPLLEQKLADLPVVFRAGEMTVYQLDRGQE